MPKYPAELLKPNFLTRLKDGSAPCLDAFRVNDVPLRAELSWKPSAPINLYHGTADDDVSFENAQTTYVSLKAIGANVQLVNLGAYDHATALSPAVYQASLWFDSVKDQ